MLEREPREPSSWPGKAHVLLKLPCFNYQLHWASRPYEVQDTVDPRADYQYDEELGKSYISMSFPLPGAY